ncbi:MAG: hypothetical protein WAM14_08995, partial [Candidatus Nitrosopolaris sp.]
YGSGYGGIGYGGIGYGGTGYGGAGPVIQEPVNTGNSQLDKAINKFYHCISHTHEDPPTIEKVDNCYYQTLGGSTGRLTQDHNNKSPLTESDYATGFK